MSLKVVIVGAGGQLGTEFLKQAEEFPQLEMIGWTHKDLDICDLLSTQHQLEEQKPDIVINCSGYTAVDKAEQELAEAYLLNATAPAQFSFECAKRGIKFIHFSTDYVFDGRSGSSYKEDDELNPLNVYGASKAKGESAVLKLCPEATVIRVSWLYSNQGQNFFLTMMKFALSGKDLDIVGDQVSSPTYAGFLVEDILSLLDSGRKLPTGILHYSLDGETSWKEFADAIFERTDHNCHVRSVSSEEYGAEALRPTYSKLDHSLWDRSIEKIDRSWVEGLELCIAEYLLQKELES